MMYELLRPACRKKWDVPLWLWLAVALALLLMAFIPIPWAYYQRIEYDHFREALNSSVLYAQKHGGTEVLCQGEVYHSADSGSSLYRRLLLAGQGKRQSRPPEETEDIRIDFGDGSCLRLWALDVYDGYTGEWVPGMFVEYAYPEGKLYRYDTDQLTWTQLRHVLPEKEQ